MSETVDLESLERQVVARYMEKCGAGWQLPDIEPLDTSDWYMGPLPGVPQFPREQWLIRPQCRIISLLTANRMLDLWDDLDDKQRTDVSILLSFGGRERIA